MRKLILLLLSLFTVSVFAGEPASLPRKTYATAPTVKALLSRAKKRQMNIYYASQANEIDNSDPDTDADDLDMHVGYRRPELDYESIPLDIDTIPGHVLTRLAQNRKQAVNRHRETWRKI